MDGSSEPRSLEEELERLRKANRALAERVATLEGTEAELRLAQQVADSSAEAMFRVDSESRFLAVNRAACDLYGYSREEFLRMSVFEIESERPAAGWPSFWSALRQQRRLVFESTNHRRNGETFPVEITATILESAGIEQCAGIVRDISELRRSEALLRSILDHTTAVIYVKRADGRYLLANAQFEKVIGLPFEQVRDRTDRDILPIEIAEAVQANDAEVLRSRVPIQREESVPLPSGEDRTYVSLKVPLIDAAGTPYAVCGISTDITESKRLQVQLLHAQRMEGIGQLAGGIAHDFNNLLTAISGYTEMALLSLPKGSPARSDIEEVGKASRRAAALTSQLLAFARKQVIEPRVVNLNEMLLESAAMLRPTIGEQIVLEFTAGPDLWNVRVDPVQVDQILVNLAVNARDAMPRGGRLALATRNLTIDAGDPRVGADLAPGEYVELTVADSGTGMSAEVQAHAFDPFFTTKSPGRGTGLGLATCHGIMKQNRGHIGFLSRAGAGTTVTLLLPRAAGPVALPAPRSEHPRSPGTETLLVVEDEPLVRDLAARTLRSAGYRILEAEGGEAAIDIARRLNEPIHLLFTDVVMPGMSGADLAAQFSRERPEGRVLFSTGYADESIAEAGVLAGGVALLRKPYTPAELTRRVREALDRAIA